MDRQEAIEKNYRQSGISLYHTQKTYKILFPFKPAILQFVADWYGGT